MQGVLLRRSLNSINGQPQRLNLGHHRASGHRQRKKIGRGSTTHTEKAESIAGGSAGAERLASSGAVPDKPSLHAGQLPDLSKSRPEHDAGLSAFFSQGVHILMVDKDLQLSDM